MQINGLLRVVALVLCCLVLPTAAKASDIHWLWDDRCADCHGHSAEFARKFLHATDAGLQGRHQYRDLRLFLRNHYAPAAEVDKIYLMLLAQASSGARFRTECSSCHGTAAAFARSALRLQNGELVGLKTRRPVKDFMQGHRGLKPEDIDFFVALLRRVFNETMNNQPRQ